MTIIKEIIDNSENNKLSDYLNNVLQAYKGKNSHLDIATAFFKIEAYELIKENIDGVARFRLLLGKAPELRNDTTLGKILLDIIKVEIEEFPFTANKNNTVKAFIEFIKRDNVEIRLYDREFLHGKAYIFDQLVIIGSSNFTPSGLTRNTELNSVNLEESKAKYVREKWYDKFWAEARDFKAELIEVLENSRFGTTEYSPYEVYIKTLYEFQKDELKAEFDEKDDKTGRPKTKVNLAEFQADAVQRAITRLEKFGAILVADSVGLGKTWIAKKILEEIGYYQRSGVLVICPAQLRGMWQAELKSIDVPDKIMSQEELASIDFIRKARKIISGKLENIELLVVDESHNFRNPLSNRWENLFTLVNDNIAQNGYYPKMIFLTATPINNTIWDLYWQIMLLVSLNRRAFIKEGIPDIFKFFKEVESKKDPTLLNDLLNEISIRRTRDYIKKNYPNAYLIKELSDGTAIEEKIKFPRRVLESINYKLDDSYKGMYKSISNVISNKLTMAYYKILTYKKSEKLSVAEELALGRMIALEGIYRTILLKRLESSVEAFRRSIKSQIDFLIRLKEYLNKGKLLTKQSFYKFIMRTDEEIEEFTETLETFNKSDFKMSELYIDIDKDIEILGKLYKTVRAIKPEEDSKLAVLKNKLVELAKDEQVIIFTYYADTLNYISEHLKHYKPLNKYRIQEISGKASTGNRANIVDDFLEGKINILVSTDVLSEGMNLQTAKYLINYDLHWNPTRMIQRAGRIDRIGSPFEKIYIHNFFPEDELEELLRLVHILQDKIINIDKSVGLDQSILGEEIHPKVFGVIRRIKEKDSTVMDELESEAFGGGEKFYQPLKDYMKKKALEDLEKIPNGIYSGLQNNSCSGIFFYHKYGEDFHFWTLFDLNTKQILRNKTEIVEYIACEPDERRVIPIFFDSVYEANERVIQQIKEEYEEIFIKEKIDSPLVELSRDKSTKIVSTVIREIEQSIDDYMEEFSDDSELLAKWEPIKEKMELIPYTKRRLSGLRKIWREYKKDKDWKELIKRLDEFVEQKGEQSRRELESFDINKLRLITIDFIS